MTAAPSSPHRVALQGFSDFERNALASHFRVSPGGVAYQTVESMAQAEFVVADADDPQAVRSVVDGGRLADTVFVGARAPAGAIVWMMRPIDPRHVMRELDAMVALRHPTNAPSPSRRTAARASPGRRASDLA